MKEERAAFEAVFADGLNIRRSVDDTHYISDATRRAFMFFRLGFYAGRQSVAAPMASGGAAADAEGV